MARVYVAIDFNHKLVFITIKVSDERAKRMLSPKLQAAKLTIPQLSPKDALWRRCCLAKALRLSPGARVARRW